MKIHCYIEPDRSFWKQLSARPEAKKEDIGKEVREILETVRSKGDSAVLAYEERFDGVSLSEGLKVTREEISEAEILVGESLKGAIRTAYDNIRCFHQAQIPSPVKVETSPGVVCIQKAVPINRVGLYVPGGRAPLFSTVLMLAIPAKVAGCPEVIICTPPGPDGRVNPAILYAASVCGVEDIYKIGGAQAIAAMAYGTESVLRCDKIAGPGNRFVTKAKQLVSESVAIDMPAGPSEVMVLADDSANPVFVAADFLSQSEHGPDSQSILVCSSHRMVAAIMNESRVQFPSLARKEDIVQSLLHSRVVVLMDRGSMVDFANLYAPEHLIINMENPWEIADGIRTAGSVFIGPWTPESAGDYASGTNHTLPTGGWARSMGGLCVDTFLRKMTIQELTEEGLRGIGNVILEMAKEEGLTAHAASVSYRIGEQ